MTETTIGETYDWIAGGGEMGASVRALDWSKTVLGELTDWPQSLRTIVSTCLSSRFPILIWWGPELVMIYNDALSRIIGNKHPRALGQRGADGWHEVWHVLGPMLTSVIQEGASTWSEDQRLDIERALHSSQLEETYFTFSYSPIRDESGGIGGVFCAVTETTARVLSERRLRTLSALARQTAEVTTASEACIRAAIALEDDAADVPIAFVYLAESDGGTRLASLVGAHVADDRLAKGTHADWPLAEVLETGNAVVVDGHALRRAFAAMGCQTAALPDAALLLPLGNLGKPGAAGVLVVGLAPLLLLDDRYRSFLTLVAGHIGTAIASARALEAAEQRANALAQLDRAKTAFFSNVSHEFRTPLTLILGPTEDALATPDGVLHGADLETVHRNGLRLLRLVNTLLDFSRIEAGRAEATFQPTDLAGLTRDFAASFRSAIERAGLALQVDCDPLAELVHVDRGMWEKIVLNLLSNALKFTFHGSIGVSLRVAGGSAKLVVSDTGVGIAEAELPRVFDRFHRIEGSRSRTHEGTGIGLALVRDLVGLHGGDIAVESHVGRGTAFIVTLPMGRGHLPPERVRTHADSPDSGVRDRSFITEALRWLPATPVDAPAPAGEGLAAASAPAAGDARILVVDDNADMREYIARLLRQHWVVDSVADGVEALAAVRATLPSLVLTDVMMPNLDGFGLLRALREDPLTRSLPVVMLSARAGEESRVEGLGLGADDYLIKPFSAKELVARVRTHLELGRLRNAAETERNGLYSLFEQAPAAIAVLRGPAFEFELSNPRYEELVQQHDLVGRTYLNVFPELEDHAIHDILREVYSSGRRFVGREFPVMRRRSIGGELEELYFDFVYDPFRASDGAVGGIMILAFEVTDRVRIVREREGLLARERLARADAERASRAKDEFLAMLGHELRNPLAPIVTALHLLRVGGAPHSDRERTIIERQVSHLTALVDDLLDISAITRGKIALKLERIELRRIVDRAMEIAHPLVSARRHEVIVQVPWRGFQVVVDSVRMAQVVSNLLTNAAKYTEPGGRIVVSSQVRAGQVELRVADNGVGISAAMIPHVFELFIQERQAIDRSRGGLGLGLAIVQNLMTLHGGSVDAASDGFGAGSAFTIRLPAAPEAVPQAGGLSDLPGGAAECAEACRVLIVDDNNDAADTLALALDALGCHARVTYDGPAALQMVDEFQPHLALLDIGLPSMDGYALARRLRAGATTSTIRLVAITGYGQKADVELAMQAGFDEHFVKPVSFEALVSLLTRVRFDDR